MEFRTTKKSINKWHIWFAWYPVCVESDEDTKKYVWFENVLRCTKARWRYSGQYYKHTYKSIRK